MSGISVIRFAVVVLGFGLVAIVIAGESNTKDNPTTVDTAAANDNASTAKSPKSRDSQQKSLTPFASLIGEWRGVGQPKRGSNRDAWTEKAEWIWDFSKPEISILGKIRKGKLAKSIRIRPAAKDHEFVVELESLTGEVTKFQTKLAGKKAVGESSVGDDGYVQRMTITQLNDKRCLLLLEKRREQQSFYRRVAGIGYTRAGTSLAVAGNGDPVCVVTGGKGTIAVSHNGKKYYVCCGGCKQAFDDDPEGILVDYRKRLKAAKAKKK
jgi:YHS domain-containing protein